MKPYVKSAIQQDSHIFYQLHEHQFQQLIVEPILSVIHWHRHLCTSRPPTSPPIFLLQQSWGTHSGNVCNVSSTWCNTSPTSARLKCRHWPSHLPITFYHHIPAETSAYKKHCMAFGVGSSYTCWEIVRVVYFCVHTNKCSLVISATRITTLRLLWCSYIDHYILFVLFS